MHLFRYLGVLGLALSAAAGSAGSSSRQHSSSVAHSSRKNSVAHTSKAHTDHPSIGHSSSGTQHPSSASKGKPTSASLTVHASITANAAPGNGSDKSDQSSKTSSAKQPAKTGVKFTVHPDGQCAKPLKAKLSSFELEGKGFPQYTTIKKPTFEGAEAKDGAGWDVYWSIPKPDEGCRYQVMLPFQQYSGTPGYPGGNEIINVGGEGCFFGSVPTDSDVYLSYCCGGADCQKASLNSTSLLSDPITRREVKLESGLSQAARALAAPKPRGGTLASRFWYNAGPAPPKKSCKIIEPGQPYSRAGQQVVVGPSQVCESSPCSIAVSYTISYSTTATSSKTTTLTNSFGASIAIKAGVDFLVDVEETTTLSYEISLAIAKTTGTDVMHGNSSTVTNTVSLALGNRGYVTFTPTYKCWTGPLDCGEGNVGPIDWCQPDLSGKGGSPMGDFYPLVTD